MINLLQQWPVIKEIMVVIIILGVLATIAVPLFRTPRERVFDNEAKTNLKLIQAAEKIFRYDFGIYYPSPHCVTISSMDAVNDNLKLDLSDKNWTIRIITWPAAPTEGAAVELKRRNPPAGWDRWWNIGVNGGSTYPDEPCCCPSVPPCLTQEVCGSCTPWSW